MRNPDAVDMMRVTLVAQRSAYRGRLTPTGWTAVVEWLCSQQENVGWIDVLACVKPLARPEVVEALAPRVGGWSPPRCLGRLAPYLVELDRDGRAEVVALLERRAAALAWECSTARS